MTLSNGAKLNADVLFPCNDFYDEVTIIVNGDCEITKSVSFASGTGQAGSNNPAKLTVAGDGSLKLGVFQGNSCNNDTLIVKTDVTIKDRFGHGGSGGQDSFLVIENATLTLQNDLNLLQHLTMNGNATLNINGTASFHSNPTILLSDLSKIDISGDGENYTLYKEGTNPSEAFDKLITGEWLPSTYSFKAPDEFYYALYDNSKSEYVKGPVKIQKEDNTKNPDTNSGSGVNQNNSDSTTADAGNSNVSADTNGATTSATGSPKTGDGNNCWYLSVLMMASVLLIGIVKIREYRMM